MDKKSQLIRELRREYYKKITPDEIDIPGPTDIMVFPDFKMSFLGITPPTEEELKEAEEKKELDGVYINDTMHLEVGIGGDILELGPPIATLKLRILPFGWTSFSVKDKEYFVISVGHDGFVVGPGSLNVVRAAQTASEEAEKLRYDIKNKQITISEEENGSIKVYYSESPQQKEIVVGGDLTVLLKPNGTVQEVIQGQ